MMFNSANFKTMQASLDALWIKQKVHSNNIANVETPGYKAKSVDFEEVLSSARDEAAGRQKGVSTFNAVIKTEAGTSNRLDENNVDLEKESLELYKTYAQTQALYTKVSGEFSKVRYVLTQFGK